MGDAHFHYLLRLGDDSLVLGQRLSEWTGHAPTIEVDLSLANIALDLVGQATHLLNHAGAIERAGRDGDALAFRREELDFQSCLLVEQPNGDFARTMARQLLFSTWQLLLYERLTQSSDTVLAAVAGKAVKEITYHAEFAAEWAERLGDGTEESHARMAEGLEWNWRFVDELFETDAMDEAAIRSGIGIDPASFRAEYDARIAAVLSRATLDAPPAHRRIGGGRQGHHSEHLGHLLAEMQYLQRAYPDARW